MINWSIVSYFSPTGDKWSEDPNKFASPRLIYSLDRFRTILNAPIYPSPAPGALARETGRPSSRHYVGSFKSPVRRSDAIDVFCSAPPLLVFSLALRYSVWGGIGVYFDTKYDSKEHVMFHFDLRPVDNLKVVWYRQDHKYYSLKTAEDWRVFFELLLEAPSP